MVYQFLRTILFLLVILISGVFVGSFAKVSAQSSLSIGNVVLKSSSVPMYDKLEITFSLQGTVATDLQFPYDPDTISGLVTGTGVTVDALFLPPGESNWANALVQPAFLFQPYLSDPNTGGSTTQWIYPKGNPYWLIRFAPKKTGTWKVKIRAQDKSNYPNWTETTEKTFSVTNARAGNNGFITASSIDTRYFQFSNGVPFIGAGFNRGFTVEKTVDNDFELYSQNGINFIRNWMDNALVFSRGTHGWDAWRNIDGRRLSEQVYKDHDFSIKLNGAGTYMYQTVDGNQSITSGLEANTNYIVRVRAKFSNTANSQLVVKIMNKIGDFLNSANDYKMLVPGTWTQTSLGDGWVTLEGKFFNDRGRLISNALHLFAVGLKGEGTVYIDEVYIGEDLGNGNIGPNILFKGRMDYHRYFDPIASANWDMIFDKAASKGVYIQSVISDKEDRILTRINSSGVYDETISVSSWNNFHSARGRKSRRLQEYYWRYLAARWSYSPAVFSWELLNEGNPGSSVHYDQANHLSETINKYDKNHMAATSFWSQFPTSFWKSTSNHYADLHAYVSTTYAYGGCTNGVPNNATLANSLMNDAAYYHTWHSSDVLGKAVGKPVIRGEGGIDYPCRQAINTDLAKDKDGVWLHNFTWAQLHHGGLYELYWWTHDIRKQPGPDANTSNGLYEIYKPFREFMKDIPLTNGKYQDINVTEPSNMRVVGQKDSKGQLATHAHLWVQNKNHTWKNVINGGGTGTVSGTVTISGFKPSTSFPVEWWDFKGNGTYTKRNTTVSSNAQGVLSLNLGSAPSGTTDTAIKIGDYPPLTSVSVTPTPTGGGVSGDANGDGKVDSADYAIWLSNYTKSTSNGSQDGDFNGNGVVEGVDYAIWLKNYGG